MYLYFSDRKRKVKRKSKGTLVFLGFYLLMTSERAQNLNLNSQTKRGTAHTTVCVCVHILYALELVNRNKVLSI